MNEGTKGEAYKKKRREDKTPSIQGLLERFLSKTTGFSLCGPCGMLLQLPLFLLSMKAEVDTMTIACVSIKLYLWN